MPIPYIHMYAPMNTRAYTDARTDTYTRIHLRNVHTDTHTHNMYIDRHTYTHTPQHTHTLQTQKKRLLKGNKS